MKKTTYNKLVRDKIPEIIEQAGKICTCTILSDEDYLVLLDKKLDEELAEYQESKSMEELADLLAKELKSPKAIDRMASWIRLARPRSMEAVADEMLAIRAEIDAWAEKKESEAAQAGITDWLNSRERLESGEQDEP